MAADRNDTPIIADYCYILILEIIQGRNV